MNKKTEQTKIVLDSSVRNRIKAEIAESQKAFEVKNKAKIKELQEEAEREVLKNKASRD